MSKKPLTQRELKQQKLKKAKVSRVTIVNRCKDQTVPIQLKAPEGVSFWVGEQTVNLYPKRMASLPENRLYWEQIRNFEKSGRIRVIGVPQN